MSREIFGEAAGASSLVEVDEKRKGTGQKLVARSSYRAIVRFTDQRGEAVLYHDSVAFNPPSFSVGQSVTVFYDPQNPQMAMIDRGAKNYLIPGIGFGLGTLITLSWLRRLFRRT